MRVGLLLPFRDETGKLMRMDGVLGAARRIEEAGFDGIWLPDHLPLPGDAIRDRGDPLMYLALASSVTRRVELGTCIFAVPIRTKFDVAQRFYSLETLAPRRFTVGVGTGSQTMEYEANGIDWDGRFRRMRDHMAGLRQLVEGAPIEEPSLLRPEGRTEEELKRFGERRVGEQHTWPMEIGMPRLVLGAWASDVQLRRAVAEYDGWMASAGPGSAVDGWRSGLGDSISRYRDLGGTRALCSTIWTDLSARSRRLGDGDAFDLRCGPEEAAERLAQLAELGYDDALVWPVGSFGRHESDWYGWSEENLALIRSLVPPDPRGPVSTPGVLGRAGD